MLAALTNRGGIVKTDIEDIVSSILVVSLVLIPLLVLSVGGLSFDEIQYCMVISYAILIVVGLVYYTILLHIRK